MTPESSSALQLGIHSESARVMIEYDHAEIYGVDVSEDRSKATEQITAEKG